MTRILVVDDESDLVDYLAAELQFTGFQTDTANNGVEAVLKVLDHTPDIILMDVRMPKLDGINALKIIRRIAPELPVLMFTGQAGQGDMYEATRLGAFTCLLKPVAVEDLLSVIRQALTHTNKKVDVFRFN